MAKRHLIPLVALAGLLGGHWIGCQEEAAKPLRATTADLGFEVPEGKECKRVTLGQLAARIVAPARGVTFSCVAVFRQTYAGASCCDERHFVNVLIEDSNPPCRDEGGGHLGKVGIPYVDPVSGGNYPCGSGVANPQAKSPGDDLPWYDGEKQDVKAGEPLGQNGYDQDFDFSDEKDDQQKPWGKDAAIANEFDDAPDLMGTKVFRTLLVCFQKSTKKICPIGGLSWQHKNDSVSLSTFSGLPKDLTVAQLGTALTNSGFKGYTVSEKCCPCDAGGKAPPPGGDKPPR